MVRFTLRGRAVVKDGNTKYYTVLEVLDIWPDESNAKQRLLDDWYESEEYRRGLPPVVNNTNDPK